MAQLNGDLWDSGNDPLQAAEAESEGEITEREDLSKNDGIVLRLNEASHGAVLHGQAVPVRLWMCLHAPPPSS